jgi:hypothetical protein
MELMKLAVLDGIRLSAFNCDVPQRDELYKEHGESKNKIIRRIKTTKLTRGTKPAVPILREITHTHTYTHTPTHTQYTHTHTHTYIYIYRVIHKSLRDFRTRLHNNQDRHGRKEHINR